MVYKRVCRDCPIEGCGAKYLVKLSNHLTDVHQLYDPIERRKYLQEAKLQPKVKFVIYDEPGKECKSSRLTTPVRQNEIVYEFSHHRKNSSFKQKQKKRRQKRLRARH